MHTRVAGALLALLLSGCAAPPGALSVYPLGGSRSVGHPGATSVAVIGAVPFTLLAELASGAGGAGLRVRQKRKPRRSRRFESNPVLESGPRERLPATRRPTAAHGDSPDPVKKLYTTARWKQQSQRAALRELKNRRRRRSVVKTRNRQRLGVPRDTPRRRRVRVPVVSPECCSLVRNPETTVRFFAAIEAVFRSRRSLYVDLSNVTELTADAVVVLLSRLAAGRVHHGTTFGGNEPGADAPRRLLEQSGFFEFVRSVSLKEPAEHGRIRRRASTQVEAAQADELVAFATERLVGRRENRRSSFLTLVECMANTHEHSGKTEGVNLWWANVYCPKDVGTAFFTIVDNGMGIFESVTVRRFRRRFQEAFGLSGNAALLKDWLEGRVELPSRTGQRNRGKGLRAIYDRMQKGKDGMANLIIIANDVYANVAQDRYETLPVPFRGTIVCWELRA